MCILINQIEKALVHSKTGEIVRPKCFDTLASHDSYLRGKKQYEQADAILKDVFKGELAITKMIAHAQELHLIKRKKNSE